MDEQNKLDKGESHRQNRVTIIAEVGSNYNNDLDLAKQYVTAVKEYGACAVKFQTLRKDKLIARHVIIDGNMSEHPAWKGFGNLELPDDWHHTLKKHADSEGIEFISTPFYLQAIELLEDVGVSRYKVASGDITFRPLLEAVGETGKPIILSTGASTLVEIEKALDILNRKGTNKITLLHCVSNYPPEFCEINLRAMVTMKKAFGLPVGISDHTPGSLIPIAAAALGAEIIEKHVTFDRTLLGPDHSFAMTMSEFAAMIRQIRTLETALGDGIKAPTEDELERRHRFRRGVYEKTTMEPVTGTKGIWLRPEKGIFS